MTKEQIQAQFSDAQVLTFDEFCKKCTEGVLDMYTSHGWFHDGETLTDIKIWDEAVNIDDVKQYPYVVCYDGADSK